MNQDVNGNRKLFWKELCKVESCSRVKDGNGRLTLREFEVRRIWKKYFKDLYNVDTHEKVGVHICGYDGVWRGSYFLENQLEKLRLRRVLKILRMERLQVRMRSQEI